MSYHGYDLSFHFAYSGEDIGVNWVGHGELSESLRLQANQLIAAVVYRPADPSILPFSMFHVGQVVQLLADLLFAPSCARKAGDALDTRSAWYKFAFEFKQGLGDLCLHFCAHTRQPQEDTVEIAPEVDIEVAERAEDTAALELVK
jgi:hypothetical protein